MKLTHRLFLVLAFFSSFALATFAQSANQAYTVLVGTYTDKTGSKGIYAFHFDPSTGNLTPKGIAAETPNPSWVVIHPSGKWVYAANESGKQSAISAFSLDSKTGKLALLNQLPSQGEDPCYLSFDKTGKYLFVANYTSGTVAVFPILPDGKLGQPTSVVKDAGTLGPNKERQEAPHAHWIEPSAHSDSVYVADLGLDRILMYYFDPASGKLTNSPASASVEAAKPFSSALEPGTGPRHAVMRGESVYVLGELQSTVTQLFPEARLGLAPVRRFSTLPPDFRGRNDAAEIAIHPSGAWLFASNRGHDSIAVFSVEPSAVKLTPGRIFPTGGKEPRHFALDPTGQFLLAENQQSNNIVVFRIDSATGALTQVSKTENIPSPVCLVFLPASPQ